MRAPYVNPEGFRFTIYRKSLFSDLGKLLGMQDIEVGDPEFDEAFIIKGNDESKVRDLFANPKIRQMIQDQPKIRLEVKDSEGWFGPKFPEDVDELSFPGRRGDQGRGAAESSVRPVRRRAGPTVPDRVGVQARAGGHAVRPDRGGQ